MPRSRVLGSLIVLPASVLGYAAMNALGGSVPSHIVLYLVTMPLGFWWLGRSVWRLTTKPKEVIELGEEPGSVNLRPPQIR